MSTIQYYIAIIAVYSIGNNPVYIYRIYFSDIKKRLKKSSRFKGDPRRLCGVANAYHGVLGDLDQLNESLGSSKGPNSIRNTSRTDKQASNHSKTGGNRMKQAVFAWFLHVHIFIFSSWRLNTALVTPGHAIALVHDDHAALQAAGRAEA